jgi:uncharacterized membrane protein
MLPEGILVETGSAGVRVDFPAPLFPAGMLWPANAVLLFVVAAALRRAPLARLRSSEFTHVYFAACVILLLLWNTHVGVLPALNFHLLGVTAITLMFGWAYAVIAVVLVSIGSLINQGGGWEALGLNVLVSGCVPILVTQALLHMARRRLPHNFFVYIYVNGFLAAGLSTLAVGLLGAFAVWIADNASSEWLSYQYYPFFPLIFFSEAFVNGMIMTALVALKPGWVSSFDDNLYLKNK